MSCHNSAETLGCPLGACLKISYTMLQHGLADTERSQGGTLTAILPACSEANRFCTGTVTNRGNLQLQQCIEASHRQAVNQMCIIPDQIKEDSLPNLAAVHMLAWSAWDTDAEDMTARCRRGHTQLADLHTHPPSPHNLFTSWRSICS